MPAADDAAEVMLELLSFNILLNAMAAWLGVSLKSAHPRVAAAFLG